MFVNKRTLRVLSALPLHSSRLSADQAILETQKKHQ